jgi:hypothetical protein
VHGPTSSGKSYVIRSVAALFPAETVLLATQITPQAFFYLPHGSLQHRLIVGGERSRVEDDESAERTRALRELLADGRLSKLVSMKGVGGRIETVHIEQPGPIAYVESTSMTKVFAEDANRVVTLFTDERPEQTKLILLTLAAGYEGVAKKGELNRIRQRHYALQRMLQPLPVIVPYAVRLAELLHHERVELRRGYVHLLSTVQASALLHQWQRERDKAGRLLATPADYQLARHLLLKPMMRLLGVGVSDQVRRFLKRLSDWAQGETFTTTKARQKEGASPAAVRGWLGELAEAGMVEMITAGRGRTPATWRLTGDRPDAGDAVLPTVEELCPDTAKPQTTTT